MLVEYYFRVRSLSVSERIPVLTGVLVTLTVFPWLMDPINIPKLTVLVLGAGVSLSLVIFNNGLKYEFKNNKILNLLIILFTFYLQERKKSQFN
jgi:hypothetical protein